MISHNMYWTERKLMNFEKGRESDMVSYSSRN